MKRRRKPVFQDHHPDYGRPDYTIRLRRWQHLMITRLNQYASTPENLIEMENVVTAVTYIRDRIKSQCQK